MADVSFPERGSNRFLRRLMRLLVFVTLSHCQSLVRCVPQSIFRRHVELFPTHAAMTSSSDLLPETPSEPAQRLYLLDGCSGWILKGAEKAGPLYNSSLVTTGDEEATVIKSNLQSIYSIKLFKYTVFNFHIHHDSDIYLNASKGWLTGLRITKSLISFFKILFSIWFTNRSNYTVDISQPVSSGRLTCLRSGAPTRFPSGLPPDTLLNQSSGLHKHLNENSEPRNQ